MSTPPRTPRALTCVELTTESRLKLDQLTTANRAHLMRLVVLDAIDILHAHIFRDDEQAEIIAHAIAYTYEKEGSK